MAYHPGFVAGTGLARDAGPVPRFAMRRILPARALLESLFLSAPEIRGGAG
ncbi:hypothetical protein [Streptomyces sp. NPDC001743]|uniref:hypothetical protein n=1 Tax=Streptomyces sp. NPDC001743 TaxID=3154397 RepID=UPI00333492A5